MNRRERPRGEQRRAYTHTAERHSSDRGTVTGRKQGRTAGDDQRTCQRGSGTWHTPPSDDDHDGHATDDPGPGNHAGHAGTPTTQVASHGDAQRDQRKDGRRHPHDGQDGCHGAGRSARCRESTRELVPEWIP